MMCTHTGLAQSVYVSASNFKRKVVLNDRRDDEGKGGTTQRQVHWVEPMATRYIHICL